MLAGLFGAVRRPRPGSAMGTAREPGGAPTPHARDRPLATTFASRRDRAPAPVEETALAATGTRQSTTSRRSKTGTALDASASLLHIHAQQGKTYVRRRVTSRRVTPGGCGLMLASSRHASFSPRGSSRRIGSQATPRRDALTPPADTRVRRARIHGRRRTGDGRRTGLSRRRLPVCTAPLGLRRTMDISRLRWSPPPHAGRRIGTAPRPPGVSCG